MSSPRLAALVLASVAVLTIPTAAAAFATIPEDEVFTRDGRRELIHVRVLDGCDDAATDRVEVEIPESVVGVVPEEVPGWTTTTEMIETEPYELFQQQLTDRVATVVWTGGPLAPDTFQDFGIAAVFTEPTDELILPVTQGCGTVEQLWDEVPQADQDRTDLQRPAPFVAVVEPPTTDVSELLGDVRDLRGEIDSLRTDLEGLRLGEVPGTRLRDRLRDAERRLDQIESEMEQSQASTSS
jgi:uncharacterized protein YcnI